MRVGITALGAVLIACGVGLGLKGQASTPAEVAKPKPVAKAPAAPAPKQPEPKPVMYAVRNGDNDWSIAKKHGISMDTLHAANPGLDWRRLQIGHQLSIPVSGAPAPTAVAAQAPVPKKAPATQTYTVREGENDWIIASKFGITRKQLYAMNPTVKWSRLPIGAKLVIPGGAKASASTGSIIKSRNAVVKADSVTVRRGPSTSSGKVVTVHSGTRVTVLDREGSWYKLKFPKGTVGWVRGDLLKAVSASQVASNSSSRSSASRSKSSSKSKSKSSAPNRKLVAANSSSTDIVERALGYRGVRYSYGSASRSATDCSGLTTQVYKAAGVSLPRTSAQQAKVGAAVSKSQLKKGDLVFFKTNRGTRINHVGIYVGDGKFVHASSGGGKVKVDSLTSGYYDRRYAGARRVAETKKAPEPKKEAPAKADEPEKVAPPSKLDDVKVDPPKADGS